ncbi:replicase, partial [Enterobacter hormaechei subsp. xiangfangensis]
YQAFPPGGSLVRSPVPAFRFTGVTPLLWPRLSHSTPDTQFREGSSLQAGLYARTPRSVRPQRLIR